MHASALSTRPVLLVSLLTGLLVIGGTTPAFAAAYDADGCVINRKSEGPVAGGSQCAGADLSGLKLGQAALEGADLTGADLTRADLQDANLTGAKLGGADFTSVKLNEAVLTGASILPDVIAVTAQTPEGVAVPLTPDLPTGLEFGGCTIAGTPVEEGAVFPAGETGLRCSFTTGQPGAGYAVVRVQVTVATPVPEAPLFTDPPTSSASTREPMDQTTTVLLIAGAAVLVLAGIGAFVASAVLRRRRS